MLWPGDRLKGVWAGVNGGLICGRCALLRLPGEGVGRRGDCTLPWRRRKRALGLPGTFQRQQPEPQNESAWHEAMLQPTVDGDPSRGEHWKLIPSGTNRMGPPLPSDLSLECPESQKMPILHKLHQGDTGA